MILNILNNKSVWKILTLMSYSSGAGYTRKEFLHLLRWNNLSLDRAIKKLEFYKIIKKDGRVIKLNFENEETQNLMPIIEQEKKRMNYPSFELFAILTEFLRLVESYNISSIYLFGSHARKTASINSDIDIAVFSQKDVNLIKAKDLILQGYDKNIELHYLKPDEKSKLSDEVKKHGVKLL